jgi:hypothetical protein
MYAGGSTGLATLRRDGFASMDAASEEGSLTTRAVQFNGRHLFVNANAGGGRLTVELLDAEGKVLRGYTRKECRPIQADGTRQQVSWNRSEDLSALRSRTLRLRFHAVRTQLFSFWISPEKSGASHGYVAAGGPDFTGPTDTIGTQRA